MERARGLSPEAVESNIRARYPLRPWFVSGPYGAGPSGLGQSGGVPAHSNVHYFESSVLDVNSAVENGKNVLIKNNFIFIKHLLVA